MKITPIENPNIPSELSKQIEAVRNQISIGEGETKRLSGLVTSLKYEVNEAVKEKGYLEEQLKNVQGQVETFTAEVNLLINEKNDLIEEKAEIIKTMSLEMSVLSRRKKAIEDAENNMRVTRQELEADIANFEVAENKLIADRKALDIRIEKLSKALA